jgi:heat shock protein HslJ
VTAYNNGKQAVVSVLAGTSLTLEFGADGRVSGSAGCNRYTGQYTVAGDAVTIGQSASTRRMCAEPAGVMEQEAAFLAALPGDVRARIDGDRLELRDVAGALRIAARAVRPAASATGDAAAVSGVRLRLPATFRGDLPCADCEGIRHRLDLWLEGVFRLHREWLGRHTTRDVFGRWRFDEARNAIELAVDGDHVRRFQIEGPQRLRALDICGNRIVSQLPYELASDRTLVAAETPLLLGGGPALPGGRGTIHRV